MLMMAKITFPLSNILAIPIVISLWVHIIALPATYRGGQSDLHLVEAYSSETVRREIDRTTTESGTELLYDSDLHSLVNARDTTSDEQFEELSNGVDGRDTQKSTQVPLDSKPTDEISGAASSTSPSNSIKVQHATYEDKTILTRSVIEEACNSSRGAKRIKRRSIGIEQTYLKNCFRYKLNDIVSLELFNSIEQSESSTCVKILGEFVELDETIGTFDDLFTKLLSRYNCHNGYSVKWNCDDCKRAYKDWLCATHLPFHGGTDHSIKPCISFCERVEQRCPYLHPITREQYGGQPVFICRDPNIPFVPTITPDIPYSNTGRCYDLCHLNPDSTELTVDSLSKYDYRKCPGVEELTKGLPEPPHTTTRTPTIDDPDYEGLFDKKVDAPQKPTYAHRKKWIELQEVLANYKNQSQTHKYNVDSPSEHSKSQTHTDLHRMS